MNIGYLKFTMNMELDFTRGKIGNIEGRATLFRAIIDRGWRLVLYSQVSTWDEKVMAEKIWHNDYGINNKWISSVEYKPNELVEDDIDLLIIENGPDNWMFKTKYGQKPFIRRCAEILDSYSGPVFILGIHPDVPFPLDKMAYCNVNYHDKGNVYRLEKGSDVEHGWADHDEICKNKTLTFFNQAYNQEKYLDHFDKKRQGYRKHNVEFHRLPVLYGKWLVPKHVRKINKNPDYDVVYLGYPRYREKEFIEYFFNLKGSVDSWGPWHKKSNKSFKEEAIRSGIKVHEFLPAQVMCTEVYNNGYLSLGLISKKLQECGWITHRTLETIHSRCLLLGLDNAIGIENYLDPEFLITGKKEMDQYLRMLKKMKFSKRKDMLMQQYEKIEKYDGEHMINHLMKYL